MMICRYMQTSNITCKINSTYDIFRLACMTAHCNEGVVPSGYYVPWPIVGTLTAAPPSVHDGTTYTQRRKFTQVAPRGSWLFNIRQATI